MIGWMDDPSPDDDMVSDVSFAVWLASLDIRVVLRNQEKNLSGMERLRLSYLRNRLGPSRPQAPDLT